MAKCGAHYFGQDKRLRGANCVLDRDHLGPHLSSQMLSFSGKEGKPRG